MELQCGGRLMVRRPLAGSIQEIIFAVLSAQHGQRQWRRSGGKYDGEPPCHVREFRQGNGNGIPRLAKSPIAGGTQPKAQMLIGGKRLEVRSHE